MSSAQAQAKSIKGVLFDIGGVVALSPMLAINAYEQTHKIPLGYINYAIVRSSPRGAWGQIERGEIPLDSDFFRKFTSDLTNHVVWSEYLRSKGLSSEDRQMPKIDGEYLFWEMMRASQEFDPYMSVAIRKIRDMYQEDDEKEKSTDGGRDMGQIKKGRRRKYVVGSCTNDYKFPLDHPYVTSPHGKILRNLFDAWTASSEVGMRKPESGIYKLAVSRMDNVRKSWGDDEGVRPEQVVFLDDIGMNLKGAAGVGIRGIRVILGETWKAVRELEGVLRLEEGSLFEDCVLDRLKREGKWDGSTNSAKL